MVDKGLLTRTDAENVVLGSAICFDECWNKANRIINEKVFSDERNKFLWGLLVDMKKEDLVVDVVSLWEYALRKYTQIQNPTELAVYICEVTMVVAYSGYDKVLSALLDYYTREIRYNGRKQKY
jgi:replicative DNA helicase